MPALLEVYSVSRPAGSASCSIGSIYDPNKISKEALIETKLLIYCPTFRCLKTYTGSKSRHCLADMHFHTHGAIDM